MFKNIFTYIAGCVIIIPSARADEVTPSYDKTQIECLARNAYHEARGEGETGMKAVSNVVMNRVKNKKWPGTPCQVIYQKNQFSWTIHGRNKRISETKMYKRSLEIAHKVYYGIYKDITFGSLFFHAISIPRRQFKLRIGNHIFY